VKNLIQTAIDTGNLKMLIKAVQEAGLIDVLSSEGPFTIFAPTDQAFAELPKKTIESLLNDKEKLTNILTYHVLLNTILIKQFIKIKNAKTVNGKNISIQTKNGFIIDNAKIIKKDIECSNGVIHVIDKVLIPK